MLAAQSHAPCAVCGVSSSDGLFPPASVESEAYRPVASRVPLCTEHKVQFLRGDLAFPRWCHACDAYRADGHAHPPSRPRRTPA
ncbi:MAG: hypothetical protein JO176_00295 [Acidimicrobiia bacterium]|nr:hypothetical protein [Acidimicrobiia bacterium]